MKVTTSALLSGLCWSTQFASAATANFYTYDPQPSPRRHPRSLAPVAARLVLAQRTGVEDFHRAEINQEHVIAAINDYGVRTPLFAEEASLKKAVIMLEEDGELCSSDMSAKSALTPYSIHCILTPIYSLLGLTHTINES